MPSNGMIRNLKPEYAHCDPYHHSFSHLFIQQIFSVSMLKPGDMETMKTNTASVLIEFSTVRKTNKEIITHLIDSLQLLDVL